MRIQIAERLKPYSHVPGTFCVLPGSHLRLQIFPALLRVHDLEGPFPVLFAEINLGITGPVKDFTVSQDLEHGFVQVWGQAKNGYFRFNVNASSDGKFFITIERAPKEGLVLNSLKIRQGDIIEVSKNCIEQKEGPGYIPPVTDRLSLGFHKAQDWSLMHSRMAMEEIMPLWMRLGQLIPPISNAPHEGTALLIDHCREVIESRNILDIVSEFQNLFLAGFEGMLSPRLTDELHQGFDLPEPVAGSKLSPLVLLTEGSSLIRSLFVKAERGRLHILPALPPEFHCGRMLGIQYDGIGAVDMEWSKKTIRRLIFHSHKEGEIAFDFQQGIKSFRLRMGSHDRGTRYETAQPISIQPNCQYFLDNFMR